MQRGIAEEFERLKTLKQSPIWNALGRNFLFFITGRDPRRDEHRGNDCRCI